MGSSSKQKGSRVEREIASKLTEAGIPSRRIVMSGAAARYDSRLTGDIDVGLIGEEAALFKAEVKARKSGQGFKQLEQWLGDNDLLFMRRNNRSPMVAMNWEVFLALMLAFYYQEAPMREKN